MTKLIDQGGLGSAVSIGEVVLKAGTNIIGKIKLVSDDGSDVLGVVDTSPAANTLLGRLKAVATALGALGYEFTINGINFNGYTKIKALALDTGAYNDHPQTLHDGGEDYKPATGKAFISFQALVWNQQLEMVGRIGEGTGTANEAITKEVLKLSNGTNKPFMVDCIGVFTADKYITAESDSGSSNYCLKAGTVLYGIEIDV